MRSLRLATLPILLALSASAASAQRLKLGAPAPEIDLPALGGGRVQLSKLRGHPVVMTYWATWCPSCRTEFPELVRAQQTHGPAGLRVLAVNGGEKDANTKRVQQYVDHFSVTFPVALDRWQKVREAFGILSLPSTMFIDSGGVVRQINMGPISREELDRGIAVILPPR